jgi:hypothetical protein
MESLPYAIMKSRYLSFAILASVAMGVHVGGCGGNGTTSGAMSSGGHDAAGGGGSGAASGGSPGGSSGSTASDDSGDDSSSPSSGSSASSGGTSGGASGGADSSSGTGSGSSGSDASQGHIKNVFIILMENTNWSDIYQSAQAPYINSLLTNAEASYATQYFDNPAAVHPSEPNYIWLEAGSNLGDSSDDDPSASNEHNVTHLATLLDAKGVTWREYAEGITSNTCPVSSNGQYACKHVPFVFFQDVVGSPPSATSANCEPHMFAFSDLAGHLTSGNVAAYNFITPNLCDDMHGNTGCPITPETVQGDTWLQTNIPVIMASNAYKEGGAIFITWDESEGGEFPIGMIVLSPFAKGKGYNNSLKYYHSSTLRTMEEVFGVSPFLNDAANQLDLSDLFSAFP